MGSLCRETAATSSDEMAEMTTKGSMAGHGLDSVCSPLGECFLWMITLPGCQGRSALSSVPPDSIMPGHPGVPTHQGILVRLLSKLKCMRWHSAAPTVPSSANSEEHWPIWKSLERALVSSGAGVHSCSADANPVLQHDPTWQRSL